MPFDISICHTANTIAYARIFKYSLREGTLFIGFSLLTGMKCHFPKFQCLAGRVWLVGSGCCWINAGILTAIIILTDEHSQVHRAGRQGEHQGRTAPGQAHQGRGEPRQEDSAGRDQPAQDHRQRALLSRGQQAHGPQATDEQAERSGILAQTQLLLIHLSFIFATLYYY